MLPTHQRFWPQDQIGNWLIYLATEKHVDRLFKFQNWSCDAKALGSWSEDSLSLFEQSRMPWVLSEPRSVNMIWACSPLLPHSTGLLVSVLTTSHFRYHSNRAHCFLLTCLYMDFRWPVAHSISSETSHLPRLLSIGISNYICLDLCAVEHLLQIWGEWQGGASGENFTIHTTRILNLRSLVEIIIPNECR